MNTGSDITTPKCPHCGNAIPAEAHGGLCPRCVLLTAATPTDAGTDGAPRGERPTLGEVAGAFPELEVLDWIGSGGMGSVYRARRRSDGTVVALKLLPKALAARPEFVERFEREARALERLRHPNIVGIHAHGQQGGFCFLMMEHVDGPNLRQAMRSGRFSSAQSLEIVPSICSALQYAHSQGVLHRDLKPENLLLDAEGRVKIADFGIAKIIGDASGAPGEITLTRTGGRLGTPHYMAPEQIERPEWVDHRADIYSVGVVFYELLTGELPLGRFPAPSTKAYIDARVDDIVFRALAKERELRQQSAEQVRAEVEGLSQPPPTPDPKPAAANGPELVLRRDSSFISTQDHLRSWYGGLYIYTGGGELELTRHTLRLRGSNPVEIPLKSITAVALGEYPRITKPTGLLHIAVRFRRTPDGPEEVLLFTPYRSMWNATWTTNEKVREWHAHLVEVVTQIQGAAPPEVIPGGEVSSGGPKRWAVMLCLFAIPMLVGIGVPGVMISMKGRVAPFELAFIFAAILGVAAAIGFVVAAFQRLIRGRWPGGWFWWLMAVVGLAVFLGLGGMLLRRETPSAKFLDPNLSVFRFGGDGYASNSWLRVQTVFWSNGVSHELKGIECTIPGDQLSKPGAELRWTLREGRMFLQVTGSHGLPVHLGSDPTSLLVDGRSDWLGLFRIPSGFGIYIDKGNLSSGGTTRFHLFQHTRLGPHLEPIPILEGSDQIPPWCIEARLSLFEASDEAVGSMEKPPDLGSSLARNAAMAGRRGHPSGSSSQGVATLNFQSQELPTDQHLRLRTVCWSNGVPTVLRELDAYFDSAELRSTAMPLVWTKESGRLELVVKSLSGIERRFSVDLTPVFGTTLSGGRAGSGLEASFRRTRTHGWTVGGARVSRVQLFGIPRYSDPGLLIPAEEVLPWAIEARIELVPASTNAPLAAAADGASLRIRSHTANSDPEWIRTTWDFESRQPATWSVDFHGRSPELAFALATNGTPYNSTLELRVERRKEGDGVDVKVIADDGLLVLDRTVKGDPVALMKEADAVSRRGGEGLEPPWPFWLAEIGGERITLRRRTVASEGSVVALIGMWRTQQEFAVRQKKVQVGLLAPSGPEMLESEYSLALAGALVHGDSLGGRRAHLEYRKRTLERVEAEVRAGRRPESDLKSARADLTAARAAVQAAEEAAARPASGTQAAPPSVSKPEGRPVR